MLSYNEFKEFIILSKEICILLGFLLGVIFALKYYFSFSPKINLKFNKVS